MNLIYTEAEGTFHSWSLSGYSDESKRICVDILPVSFLNKFFIEGHVRLHRNHALVLGLNQGIFDVHFSIWIAWKGRVTYYD